MLPIKEMGQDYEAKFYKVLARQLQDFDFCYFRPVRGDGNCYFRAVGIAYFEDLLLERQFYALRDLRNLILYDESHYNMVSVISEARVSMDEPIKTTKLKEIICEFLEILLLFMTENKKKENYHQLAFNFL